MLNLVLMGPQGSGKGTQAEKIVTEYGLVQIEAGALIRKRAKFNDKKADIIDHLANKKGQLLPDGVVLGMIYEEVGEVKSSKGYLFDGFPRSVKQYEALKGLLEDKGMKLTAALYLGISDEEAKKRLGSRRLCEVCHLGYSLLLEPNRKMCTCGGNLIRRSDDEPEAISRRLDAFHFSTQPILDIMKQDGVLAEINGEQPIDLIYKEIKQKIDSLKGDY